MATQIAATPVVRGEAAKAILKEMQRKPSEESRHGAEILTKKFENIVER